MSIDIEQEVWINRPVNDVFAFMTDVENLQKYVPGVLSARRVDDGEPGVGTQIALDYRFLGMSFEIVSEWTEYEPGARLGSKNIKGASSLMSVTYQEENGGTRLKRSLKIEPDGFMGKLTMPLIRRSTRRNVEQEFATLKDLLEDAPDA